MKRIASILLLALTVAGGAYAQDAAFLKLLDGTGLSYTKTKSGNYSVTYDLGEGTPSHQALSCKLMTQPGMRVTEFAQEIKYCLRTLDLGAEEK